MHTEQFLHKLTQRFISPVKPGKQVLSLTMTALLFQSAAAYAQKNEHDQKKQPAAGHVSLVIGIAYAEGPERSKRQKLSSGMPVYEKDRLVTSSGGHVHIRFIDNGLVSLRPDSQLEIAHYTYNASMPEKSTIKFNLEEGIARSVSGTGAKAARHRFRMNTPIAAIGVRGTDFVVSAGKQDVRAIVNEGIIVVAPFSDQCTASALGPCNVNAVELNGLSKQMLEYNTLLDKPRLVPVNAPDLPDVSQQQSSAPEKKQVTASEQTSDQDQQASSESDNSSTEKDSTASEEQTAGQKTSGTNSSQTENTDNNTASDSSAIPDNTTDSSTADNEAASEGSDTSGIIQGADTDTTDEDIRETITDRLSDSLPGVIDYTPTAPLDTNALKRRQLAWGRWGQTMPNDVYMLKPGDLSGRKVTVGNTRYALYRLDTGATEVQAGLGDVNLNLRHAQVNYNEKGGSTDAMRVSGGWLNINFNNQTFRTGLTMDHNKTGDVLFSAEGDINKHGYFSSKTNDSQMAGAVSLDSREAGYFFEKQLENGFIEGTTLWERPE
ncbi:FecR family protein [Oceanospirillum sediminis]|uniref:FecR domain-containing protein n=1 Tax=Oceanospirillum sediminis TaxID=2760088 RepID=A0A839IU58_9GAMM|nr:FecR family protein [Oceanospirillum sediminis]MBB1488220.1 FecR domain-containing protein [Oceanospirillum sediminis]